MKDKFTGLWTLQSWTISYPSSGKVTEPYGSDAQGRIVYTADGWMSAVICRAGRPSLPGNKSLRAMEADLLAEAFTSYFHYAGPYRIEGDTVIHTVEMSLNPNFLGTEQRRQFKFDTDRLTLSAEEAVGDDTRLNTLCWRRTQ